MLLPLNDVIDSAGADANREHYAGSHDLDQQQRSSGNAGNMNPKKMRTRDAMLLPFDCPQDPAGSPDSWPALMQARMTFD